MKKLLSLLLAVVLLNVQAFALSGGPVYGGTNIDTVGTYSGVLIPQDDESDNAAAAVGIFSFAQPDTGVGTGAVALFVNGVPFTGSISGVIDPQNGAFRGVITGASTYNVVFFVPTTTTTDSGTETGFERQEFAIQATGSIEAVVFDNASILSASQLNSSRIEGDADVSVYLFQNDDGSPDITRTVSFTVEGFKQSSTATGSTSIDLGGLTGTASNQGS